MERSYARLFKLSLEKLKLQSELNLQEDVKIVLLINSPVTTRLGAILAKIIGTNYKIYQKLFAL